MFFTNTTETVLSVVVLVLVLSPTAECGCLLFMEKARCEGGIPASLPLSLRALDVSNSSLEDWTALTRLDNLEDLDMDRCGVDRLPLGVFPQLQRLVRLDLSGNRLTSISRDAFQLNAKLRLLSLSSNPLQLDTSSPFLVSYSVTKLQLRDCGIRQVSSVTFRDVKALRFLDLSGNRIRVLHSGSFSNNAELRIVDLSLNDLSRVDSDIFAANTKLVDVNLSGNNLSLDAETPFLISSSIEYLLLANCGVRQVSNVTFREMKALRLLDLSGNRIRVLGAGSFGHQRLSVLRIEASEGTRGELSRVCGVGGVVVLDSAGEPLLGDWCEAETSTRTTIGATKTTVGARMTTVDNSRTTIGATNSTVGARRTAVGAQVTSVDTWLPAVLLVALAALCALRYGYCNVATLCLRAKRQRLPESRDLERPILVVNVDCVTD